LTVDDDHLEQVFPGGSLDHRPFQLFFKRLRKSSRQPLRYLMCAEYGETTQRPHYHCVIFGLKPDDGRPVAIVKTDPLLGTSRTLYSGFCQAKLIEDAWPYGHVYIGNVSPASIAYVAGYTLKQYTLGRDDEWYKSRKLAPEYHKWSRRPGLGHLWMQRNFDDLWCNNQDLFEPLLVDNTAIFNGRRMVLPKAYRARLLYLDEHQDKSPLDPLQVRRKLDIMSVSLERQLVLADYPATEHNRQRLLEVQQVLKNRHDKQKYDVARRKRL